MKSNLAWRCPSKFCPTVYCFMEFGKEAIPFKERATWMEGGHSVVAIGHDEGRKATPTSARSWLPARGHRLRLAPCFHFISEIDDGFGSVEGAASVDGDELDETAS